MGKYTPVFLSVFSKNVTFKSFPWGFWKWIRPRLPDLFEDCLFQGFTGERGTIAAPCRAKWCRHSWASAGWVRSGLTSPMRWHRDRLLLETWQVFLHSSELFYKHVLVQSSVASVPRLEARSSTAATPKWHTQQNPTCCHYPGDDGKQIFWQLSDTQMPPPAPAHWPAQSQEPLLLLPRKNTTPCPGASHHQQSMHVCMVWTCLV